MSACAVLTDPVAIAKQNEQIKKFLQECPDAEILAIHLSPEQSKSILSEIRSVCGEQITAKEYYRITVKDDASGLSLITYLDWQSKIIECAYTTGQGKCVKEGEMPKTNETNASKHNATQNVTVGTLTLQCTDTDGGKEIKVKGTATNTAGGKGEDVCSGADVITEHYCNNDGTFASVDMLCLKGFKCENGACIEGTPEEKNTICTDTDSGKIIDTKGTVTNTAGAKAEDTCLDDSKVTEYYCNPDGTFAGQDLSCPSGNYCEDGACKEGQAPPITSLTCTDSDGGKDVYTKGTATNTAGGKGEDSCIGTSKVAEYYCNPDGTYAEEDKSCPSGYQCSSGACVESEEPPQPSLTCSDTDGGKTYNTKGTASNSAGGSGTDTCSGTSVLTEYYCNPDGTYASIDHNCGSGYECSNGACSQAQNAPPSEPACTDTDNGKNYNLKGTVTNKWGGRAEDVCSGKVLTEAFCNADGTFGQQDYTCPNTCSNGACS